MATKKELMARIAELESIVEKQKTIANGIQGSVTSSKHNLTMLVWGLESVQNGAHIGEVDWLYIMRDVTRTIASMQCIENLVDDIKGAE